MLSLFRMGAVLGCSGFEGSELPITSPRTVRHEALAMFRSFRTRIGNAKRFRLIRCGREHSPVSESRLAPGVAVTIYFANSQIRS